MAVGVEVQGFRLRCPHVAVHGVVHPSPPLRQAAGRYMPLPLLRCIFISNPLTES